MAIDIRTPEELLADLGAGIKAKRLYLNLSQEDVARKAGLNRSSVVAIESGCSAHVDTLVRVLHAIGASNVIDGIAPKEVVSPIAVFRGEEKPQKQRVWRRR